MARLGRAAWALAFGLAVLPAQAAVRKVPLNPAVSVLRLRAHALRFFPINIVVQRFSGSLAYDPLLPDECQVQLTADVASMHTPDPERQARLLGPDFMDAAHYPTFVFTGRCVPGGDLSGELTMHGVTRPFALKLDWKPGRLTAEGQIGRARWGITAMPVLVGPTIEVSVSTDIR